MPLSDINSLIKKDPAPEEPVEAKIPETKPKDPAPEEPVEAKIPETKPKDPAPKEPVIPKYSFLTEEMPSDILDIAVKFGKPAARAIQAYINKDLGDAQRSEKGSLEEREAVGNIISTYADKETISTKIWSVMENNQLLHYKEEDPAGEKFRMDFQPLMDKYEKQKRDRAKKRAVTLAEEKVAAARLAEEN